MGELPGLNTGNGPIVRLQMTPFSGLDRRVHYLGYVRKLILWLHVASVLLPESGAVQSTEYMVSVHLQMYRRS
jgi:hypothetical protein